MRKALKRFLITFAIGLGASLLIGWARGLFDQTGPVGICRILSDAFFLVGAVLTGIGALLFCANEGTFDMLPYGMTALADKFRKEKKQRYKTYYDYRMARAEKKLPFGFLLLSGLVFLALAVVMLALFNRLGA